MDGAVVLTSRFADAVAYASEQHAGQRRKGTAIPYVAHLLGAASLLLEQPDVTEEQAIAALLHDVVEDTAVTVEEVRARFGAEVARMVEDCTDADEQPKPPWRLRKAAYLAHLQHVDVTSLQVSLADKLHNATAIRNDLAIHGPLLWQRFTAPPPAQHWYYTALAEVFLARLGNELSHTLRRTVDELFEGVPVTVALPDRADRPAWMGVDSLTGAAADVDAAARTAGGPLTPVGDGAWTSADGRWWVEDVATGDPGRPLAIFIDPSG
jgi:hypothetical protein